MLLTTPRILLFLRFITAVYLSLPNNMVQCRFNGNNWRILGDVISKNFSIVDVDNAQICNHIKHPLGCELEIADAQNELICLMTALCVNMKNTVDKREVQVV